MGKKDKLIEGEDPPPYSDVGPPGPGVSGVNTVSLRLYIFLIYIL